jgi:hypothetical protein
LDEPKGAWSRVGALLLRTILSKLFVIGSLCLAVVGLLLVLAGMLTGIIWLTSTGAALAVPFALVLCTVCLLLAASGKK